ncbi:MAG: hypothetical protein PHG91_07900 [Syntrophales bacterium]|jgi:hypothetical protein|nr:hypothetical protein [Syntrophales bacterium]MDD5233304.1 hypothetical protein [Syntrophales bacterium]MDD5531178.1 hypothetical protein [Syntrophales bacterium]HPL62292.1 hypothetical protein [Syntrophales bacterium]
MLSQDEIRERARYCCCVFLQLSWLSGNEEITAAGYKEALKKSSLGLGEDDFILQTIDEAVHLGRPDGGLTGLVAFYEGLACAYGEVLESDLDTIRREIGTECLKKLAGEVNSKVIEFL